MPYVFVRCVMDNTCLHIVPVVNSPAEKKLSIQDQECLAIVYWPSKWRHYLLGRHFYVCSGHRGLSILLQVVYQETVWYIAGPWFLVTTNLLWYMSCISKSASGLYILWSKCIAWWYRHYHHIIVNNHIVFIRSEVYHRTWFFPSKFSYIIINNINIFELIHSLTWCWK